MKNVVVEVKKEQENVITLHLLPVVKIVQEKGLKVATVTRIPVLLITTVSSL